MLHVLFPESTFSYVTWKSPCGCPQYVFFGRSGTVNRTSSLLKGGCGPDTVPVVLGTHLPFWFTQTCNHFCVAQNVGYPNLFFPPYNLSVSTVECLVTGWRGGVRFLSSASRNFSLPGGLWSPPSPSGGAYSWPLSSMQCDRWSRKHGALHPRISMCIRDVLTFAFFVILHTTTGWTVRTSNLGRGKRFPPWKVQIACGAH